MRKIKKINGYLIVKFNDREKRVNEGTGLGEYGVIDAELYTGHLNADRDAMKCDNAGTLEAAVELARGLEAELDIIDEPATCIVVIEGNDTFSEKEVDPQRMVNRWKERLEERIKDGHSPELNADTAAHELYGYQAALSELGFLSEDEDTIQPNIFSGYGIRTSPSGGLEEFLSSVCDNVCKYRLPNFTQEELDIMCAGCTLRRLASYQYQLSYLIKGREKEVSRIDERIRAETKEKEPPDKQMARCEGCPFKDKQQEFIQLAKFFKEVEKYVNSSPCHT